MLQDDVYTLQQWKAKNEHNTAHKHFFLCNVRNSKNGKKILILNFLTFPVFLMSNIWCISLFDAGRVSYRGIQTGRYSRRLIPCYSCDYILCRPCCREHEEDESLATEYEFYICNAATKYRHVTASMPWQWTVKICLCVLVDLFFYWGSIV